MRILQVFDGDYPWDVRVEKLSETLLEAGHETRLLCRNQKGSLRQESVRPGWEITRLAQSGAASFPAFFNPIWVRAVWSEIRNWKPDAVLVRDLPLAPLGVFLSRRARLPVLADLAEPYPDSLRSQRQFDRMSLSDRLIRNPEVAEMVERYVVRRLDLALVVCPEAGARLERQGLPRERWVEVGNTPQLEKFQPSGAPLSELEAVPDGIRIFFSGLIAGDRGLDTAIDALALLEQRNPGRFVMVVVGDGPVRTALAEQARQMGIADRVCFPGYIDHGRLADAAASADIGILPFHACPHIESTLANKLFEYMAVGLPLVCSDVAPMLRILDETHAGVSFRAGDPVDLAESIEKLAADSGAAQQHGEAGLRAVRERYHWGVDAARFLLALEAL